MIWAGDSRDVSDGGPGSDAGPRGRAGGPVSGGWDDLLAPLLRARRFDELLVENAHLVSGAFHVSIGVEATAAALAATRRDGDVAMLNHRNHGHLAALGSDPEGMYRELLGRDGGPQRGRAGSFHLADPDRGVPYTSAMLGGGPALAAGLALAQRRRGEPGIAVAFFGDGAMGEGIIYETFNLTVAWGLAVVFVCENNAPAGGEGELARLARAHGLEAGVVDGRFPRDTRSVFAAACDAVRAGALPQFLEVGSEPWPGNDSFIPRPTPWLEIDAVTEPPRDRFDAGDPVRAEARALLHQGTPLDQLQALDTDISASVRRAFAAAVTAPVAPASAAMEAVWARP
jgi:TPP-dependent pyruvate/acetoin dehydrogenase alpha subunit